MLPKSNSQATFFFVLGGLTACLLGCAACSTATKLSVKDQQTIQTNFQKKTFYLTYPVFVGSFYAYDDRHLVSERAFDERILIESPSGEPILPPSPTDILPLGTKVSVREIEFPSSSVLLARKLMSPRHYTWIMLDLAGKSPSKPYVLIIHHDTKNIDEFRKTFATFLSEEDPRNSLKSLSDQDRKAIDAKTVFKGMSAQALLKSRGQPDKRSRVYQNSVPIETWQYTPNRIVILKDNRVDRFEGFTPVDLKDQTS